MVTTDGRVERNKTAPQSAAQWDRIYHALQPSLAPLDERRHSPSTGKRPTGLPVHSAQRFNILKLSHKDRVNLLQDRIINKSELFFGDKLIYKNQGNPNEHFYVDKYVKYLNKRI